MVQGREAVLVGADPMPVDDHFFSRRIPRFSPEVSQQLVAALRGGGFLDEHNYIKDDPRLDLQCLLRRMILTFTTSCVVPHCRMCIGRM